MEPSGKNTQSTSSEADTGRPGHTSLHNTGTGSQQNDQEIVKHSHCTWSTLHSPRSGQRCKADTGRPGHLSLHIPGTGFWQRDKADITCNKHSHHSSSLCDPGIVSRHTSKTKTGRHSNSDLHNSGTRQSSEADTTKAQHGHKSTHVKGDKVAATQTGPETGKNKCSDPI